MWENLEEKYIYLYTAYFRRLITVSEKMIKNAKDELYLKGYLRKKYDNFIENLIYVDEPKNIGLIELLDVFDHYIAMGASFDTVIKRLYQYMKGILKYDANNMDFYKKNDRDIPYTFPEKFSDLEKLSPDELLWCIARRKVHLEFLDYLNNGEHYKNNIKAALFPDWKTEESETETEIKKPAHFVTQENVPAYLLKNADISISVRLLAVYYMLKAHNIMPSREDGNVADYTRLAFMLIGKDPTKVTNSDQYRNFLNEEYPYIKSKQRLKQNLEEILPYFEKVNVQPVVRLIKEELEALFKE